jgi:glycosyltransferase involved in cell wall biosynthesis
VVGHTGRFSYPKNHGFILDIFREIKQAHPDSILLLIGDGENREDIEAQIKREKLEGAVVLEGMVENVFDYVQAMDVFLFPSRYEGLSVALIEAQAAGLRCFTSDGVVSKEHSITGLVEYIPLSKGSKYWAERVLQSKEGYGRKSMYDEVVDAGYDITQNAAWLENYYIDMFNSIKN